MDQSFFSSKSNRVLGAVALVMVILTLASLIILNLARAEQATMPAMITVEGTGEVVAIPDVATFSFAVEAEADTAEAAQGQSAEIMNAILAYLEEQGVAEEDIETTNYNLYPRYTFEERICPMGSFCPPGERVQDGFTATQRVEVKARETDQAGQLIAGVGERGASNISGLEFTVDDTEALEAEARAQAIDKARTEAETLAENLGVRIVRISGYYENMPYRPYERGGFYAEDARMMEAAVAPEFPMGEDTTSVSVSITYEVR
jgi:uncharacterized protein YggE